MSRSRLHHRLVAARAERRAGPGRALEIVDVRPVVLREFAHRRAKDRRRRDTEAAERELLHVIAELAEPREIRVAAERRRHAFEDALDALRADAAWDADRAALLCEIREEPARLAHHADVGPYRTDLSGAHVRAGRLQVVVVELCAPSLRREQTAGGSADVDRFQLGGRAAGSVEDRAERRSEIDLVYARLLDRSGYRHQLRLGLCAFEHER